MSACLDGVSKKLKTTMKIGTHNGGFHCDELLACFMLKKLPEYKDADIVRLLISSLLSLSGLGSTICQDPFFHDTRVVR